MRTLTRLHTCIAATIIVILYLTWFRPSLQLQENIQKVWRGNSLRVVVFGDDWSDVGEYRVSPPPSSLARDRDPDRGEMWTEALCKKLKCDAIDNYARSKPVNVAIETIGSMVDSDLFANSAIGNERNATLALFDFKTQVQQFLNFEKEKITIPERLRKVEEHTIFTVFFGIWDILEYSTLSKEDAIDVIEKSIEGLFCGLDTLADHVKGDVKVVIPKAMDPTFLPWFQEKRNDSADIFAEDQHQTVFLWTFWNTALASRAANWGRGEIFLLDLHGIIMEQVRANQLYSHHVSDASGSGKQTPLFSDVRQPCLSLDLDHGELQAAGVEKCVDPGKYLFWDNLRLSGPAHRLIGQEAADLVSKKNSINIEARERALQGSTETQGNNDNRVADFDLKFPPGY
ncbi:hypothetical protein B0J11DRAFT_99673 [Dendryphion nanum]|uniref:Uncharacterized protein n=1 Tax=Dendryphion nanum TaxID=256645 RepID=A0A9P9DCY7_9PLEO|nr:hypothetical protein B0J11DRAFT_99673 [Dendryphion nanum]